MGPNGIIPILVFNMYICEMSLNIHYNQETYGTWLALGTDCTRDRLTLEARQLGMGLAV